jgi:TonB dependent receptor
MTDENDLKLTLSGTGPFPSRDIETRSERRRRDTDVRLDVEARYAAGPLRETSVTLEHVVSKQEDESSEIHRLSGGHELRNAFWINQRTAIARVGLTQRLRLGQSLEVNGGLGLDQVRVNDVRWRVPVSPHVSLSLDARRFVPATLGRLRLRTGFGDVANVPQTTSAFFFFPPAPAPGVPERPRAEVTRERELGFDATTASERVGLSFTWYTKRTNNVSALVEAPQPSPSPVRLVRIEVLNRGVEASVHARILELSRVSWYARAWYAYNHNEVTSGAGEVFLGELRPFNPQFFFSPQSARQGTPLGAHRVRPIIAIRDLDGDGLVDDACSEDFMGCEAIVQNASEFRAAYPPTSASVDMSVRFGPVTMSAMLDRRSGHVVNNVTMQARCARECQALYDPSTPLRDQAEAILAPQSVGATVQDASYTKLRELSVKWDAPMAWARAMGGSRLTVSLAGRNIALWTDYKGLDPESTSAPWAPLASFDEVAVPLPKRFTVRAQLHGR